MAATLSRRLELIIAATGVMETERLQPDYTEEALVSGQVARAVLNLAVGATVTPMIGDLVPKYWFVLCTHATASMVVSFGADRFQLGPGEWNFYSNAGTPTFEPASVASQVCFAAIEA